MGERKYTLLTPEEIRREVNREAKKQFLKRGIAKTEMKQIAKTVGIGRTTLYRYYPQKEQLAFQVALGLISELLDATFEEAGKCHSGYDKLYCFCSRFVSNVTNSPNVLLFFSEFDHLFSADYPDIPEAYEYEARMRGNMEAVADMVREGQADGSIIYTEEPQMLATILVNTVMGLAQRTVARNLHYQKEHGEESTVIVKSAVGHLLRTVRV